MTAESKPLDRAATPDDAAFLADVLADLSASRKTLAAKHGITPGRMSHLFKVHKVPHRVSLGDVEKLRAFLIANPQGPRHAQFGVPGGSAAKLVRDLIALGLIPSLVHRTVATPEMRQRALAIIDSGATDVEAADAVGMSHSWAKALALAEGRPSASERLAARPKPPKVPRFPRPSRERAPKAPAAPKPPTAKDVFKDILTREPDTLIEDAAKRAGLSGSERAWVNLAAKFGFAERRLRAVEPEAKPIEPPVLAVPYLPPAPVKAIATYCPCGRRTDGRSLCRRCTPAPRLTRKMAVVVPKAAPARCASAGCTEVPAPQQNTCRNHVPIKPKVTKTAPAPLSNAERSAMIAAAISAGRVTKCPKQGSPELLATMNGRNETSEECKSGAARLIAPATMNPASQP